MVLWLFGAKFHNVIYFFVLLPYTNFLLFTIHHTRWTNVVFLLPSRYCKARPRYVSFIFDDVAISLFGISSRRKSRKEPSICGCRWPPLLRSDCLLTGLVEGGVSCDKRQGTCTGTAGYLWETLGGMCCLQRYISCLIMFTEERKNTLLASKTQHSHCNYSLIFKETRDVI